MKVLHIVAGDLSGGAARGSYWLHLGLRELGIDSKIVTDSKETFGDKDVVSITGDKISRLFCMARRQLDVLPLQFQRSRKPIIFSTGFVGFDFTKTKEYKEADIIHLHWINGGLVNIKHLSKIHKPIIWTMRDMWPMTGGCHYSMECERYKIGCGQCQQLNSHHVHDLSKRVFNRKLKYIPHNTKFVGISNWLTERAKESFLLRNLEVNTIYNNIDVKSFFPVDKQSARKTLDIYTGKKIILAGSQNVNDFYKGFDKFIESIKSLDKDKYFLCFFGRLDPEVIDPLGFEYLSFGFLRDNVSLRLLYSAADVFVAPSIMDAFGKTLAESMACGTPVVCFDATGPKDIVDHHMNGYKAVPYDSHDLAEGIKWVLNSGDYRKLSQNAREKAIKCFDSTVIAKQYIELYNSVLK